MIWEQREAFAIRQPPICNNQRRLMRKHVRTRFSKRLYAIDQHAAGLIIKGTFDQFSVWILIFDEQDVDGIIQHMFFLFIKSADAYSTQASRTPGRSSVC